MAIRRRRCMATSAASLCTAARAWRRTTRSASSARPAGPPVRTCTTNSASPANRATRAPSRFPRRTRYPRASSRLSAHRTSRWWRGSTCWPTQAWPRWISASQHPRLAEARRLAEAGHVAEAVSLLQSAARELAGSPDARRPVMEQLLVALFELGRDGRFSRLFREYSAEFAAEPDRAFDDLYLAGLLATRTGPVPLTRRDRFLRLLREFEQTLDLEGRV